MVSSVNIMFKQLTRKWELREWNARQGMNVIVINNYAMYSTLSISQSPNSLTAQFACLLFYILSQLT